MRWPAPPEFVQPATQAPVRVRTKRSPHYLVSWRRLMQEAVNGGRDFVASWQLPAMAKSLQPSKGSQKEKSPNGRAVHTDSATIRSLFQTDSNKLLPNYATK